MSMCYIYRCRSILNHAVMVNSQLGAFLEVYIYMYMFMYIYIYKCMCVCVYVLQYSTDLVIVQLLPQSWFFILFTCIINKQCAALFFYLSKAFDAVGHSILLNKLLALGFDVSAYNWFHSYLTSRTLMVLNQPLVIYTIYIYIYKIHRDQFWSHYCSLSSSSSLP